MFKSANLELLLITGLVFFSFNAVAAENEIFGTWVNQAGDGLIKISKQGENYVGVIEGSNKPGSQNRKDEHNPDPELRSRPLLGLKILGDLSYKGDNEWEDGWIYDPNNGDTYQCQATLEDKNTLAIRGFIGFSLFGRTETWKRKTVE